MLTRKPKLSTLVFVLLLAVSGISFGFLVGRSQQMSSQGNDEQFQAVTSQVQSGGALLARVFKGVRYIFIQ